MLGPFASRGRYEEAFRIAIPRIESPEEELHRRLDIISEHARPPERQVYRLAVK
jgi:hypothetical protein